MNDIIIVKIVNFKHFDATNKILAYAGMSPFTYQSGQLNNCYSYMEKQTQYLCYTLLYRDAFMILKNILPK